MTLLRSPWPLTIQFLHLLSELSVRMHQCDSLPPPSVCVLLPAFTLEKGV